LSSPIFVANVEYERQSERIYKILGSWDWFEDPGFSIPAEIVNITGITDEMVAGQRIDDSVLTQFEILGSAFGCRKFRGIDAAGGGGGPSKPNGAPAMHPR
jgi:hypothetical protein